MAQMGRGTVKEDQFPVLARRHRVVRYDLHGYGRSGTPQGPYSHHEALRGLLHQLGIERAALPSVALARLAGCGQWRMGNLTGGGSGDPSNRPLGDTGANRPARQH